LGCEGEVPRAIVAKNCHVVGEEVRDGEVLIAVTVEVGGHNALGLISYVTGLEAGWVNFPEPWLRRIVTLSEKAFATARS
jgi:hypothetical protein